MKLSRWLVIAVLVSAVLLVIVPACRIKKELTEVVSQSTGPVLIEFDIRQDMELPLRTPFNEPAQFAIWLEEPVSGRLQTIFVTYRSATGDWVGTAQRPGALPRWFEVFRQETNSSGLPNFDNPASDAVTGATPQQECFKTSIAVAPGSRWICWIEVNLAGDFNAKYKAQDEVAKTVDWDFVGQPALIYRAQITAKPGEKVVPQLYGQSVLNSPDGQTVQPVSDDVTTAKRIFKTIEISVIRPEPNSPG
ncbi:MAG: hypothetical protein ACYS1A_06750 [Planctomycetota bacterium]|jgi:hypothetical protein